MLNWFKQDYTHKRRWHYNHLKHGIKLLLNLTLLIQKQRKMLQNLMFQKEENQIAQRRIGVYVNQIDLKPHIYF